MLWLVVALACIAAAIALVSSRFARKPATQTEPTRVSVPLLSSLLPAEAAQHSVAISYLEPPQAPATALLEGHVEERAPVLEGVRMPTNAFGVEAKLGLSGGSRLILKHVPEIFTAIQATPLSALSMTTFGESDQGTLREHNEDCLLLLQEEGVVAVADGMGGHRGGEVASSLAVDSVRMFLGALSRRAEQPIPAAVRLGEAVASANRIVFDAAQADPTQADMGTTLVVARFVSELQLLYVAHVGDSRCYRMRSDKLALLTVDHTMRELGLAGPLEGHLSRAIGLEPNVDVDAIVEAPRAGDLYLLCTDGLTKMLSDDLIRDALTRRSSLESTVQSLIALANEAGGRDNVTVILVEFGYAHH